jgi:hypothetical protein
MGGKEKAPVQPPSVTADEAYLEAVREKRICLFKQFKDRQDRERSRIGGDPIRFLTVTYPITLLHCTTVY